MAVDLGTLQNQNQAGTKNKGVRAIIKLPRASENQLTWLTRTSEHIANDYLKDNSMKLHSVESSFPSQLTDKSQVIYYYERS